MFLFKKNKKKCSPKNLIKHHYTFTKIAISFILICSEIEIAASYILAFLGKDVIAEALSSQIVITIVGTIVAYFIKSLIENLSKYTNLFGKKKLKVQESEPLEYDTTNGIVLQEYDDQNNILK